MSSKNVSEQRNEALECRKEMKQKNPTVQAYIDCPGTDTTYRQEKEF